MDTKSNFRSTVSHWFSEDGLQILGFYAVGGLCFLGLLHGIWVGGSFREKCGIPLELAEAASSISIASEQLSVVMVGCKEYQSEQTQGFWQKNLEQQMRNLQKASPSATIQSEYLILKQFKETMEEAKQNIHNPEL